MAARSRPRHGQNKEEFDTHEERAMWSTIVNDLKKLKTVQSRAMEVAKSQSPTVNQVDELQELYREGVCLAEEEQRMLNEEPADIIKNVGILVALRTASETEHPSRGLAQQIKTPRNAKRHKLDHDIMAGDSAQTASPLTTASPTVAATVGKARNHSLARSAPAPTSQNESGSKVEDFENCKGQAGEKAGKFFVGAEVAYRQIRAREDGSQWIQCNITNISERGMKRFYEVQDPEPDESGALGQIYKTSAAALIAIPRPDALLPDFSPGKHVLARYPETTTFYRAEVTGARRDVYKLKFEDDQNQEMEVARRFVLDVGTR